MTLATKSFHWRPSFDLSWDGHSPLGDKAPVPLTAGWGDLTGLIALIRQRTTGSAFSQNIRQYVTGTGASAAVLGLTTATGDDAVVKGWQVSGDTLSNAGNVTGLGTFRLSATIDNVITYSSPLAWEWDDPPIVIPPTTNTIKWHPGHFIGNSTIDTVPQSNVTEVAGMKAIAPEVMGLGLYFSWRSLEPSRGVYNLTALTDAITRCWAVGLRVWIFIQDDTFGAGRNCPDYLTTEPSGQGGIWSKSAGGQTPMIWLAPIMDRLIALYQRLGLEYDSHPGVEIVSYRELTPSLTAAEYTGAHFSASAYFTQLNRWVVAMKAAWPHTNIAAPGNFSVNQSLAGDWVKYCYDHGVGIGGPDTYPQAPYLYGGSSKGATWTDSIIQGKQWNGSSFVAGGFDYRGKMLVANQVQGPDMGRGYTWPPRAFYEYAMALDGLGESHMYWWRKDTVWSGSGYPTAAQQTYWSSTANQPNAALRIKDFLLTGGHPMRAAAPSFYNGNISTS